MQSQVCVNCTLGLFSPCINGLGFRVPEGQELGPQPAHQQHGALLEEHHRRLRLQDHLWPGDEVWGHQDIFIQVMRCERNRMLNETFLNRD